MKRILCIKNSSGFPKSSNGDVVTAVDLDLNEDIEFIKDAYGRDIATITRNNGQIEELSFRYDKVSCEIADIDDDIPVGMVAGSHIIVDGLFTLK